MRIICSLLFIAMFATSMSFAESVKESESVAIITPSSVCLAKQLAIPIRVEALPINSFQKAMKLKASIGVFENNESSTEIILNNNNSVDRTLDLRGIKAKDNSIKLELTDIDGVLLKTAEILITVVKTITFKTIPENISIGQAGYISVIVSDQFMRSISEIPVLLKCQTPENKFLPLSGQTNCIGEVVFALPPFYTAGTAYIQVIAENVTTEQLPIRYIKNDNLPEMSMHAVISVVDSVMPGRDDSIPIAVLLIPENNDVILPKSIIVVSENNSYAIRSGSVNGEVDINDGVGHVFLNIPRKCGLEENITIKVFLTVENEGNKILYNIGQKKLSIIKYGKCLIDVIPNGSTGTLHATVYDTKGSPVAFYPMTLYYSEYKVGQRIRSFTTDVEGNISFQLPLKDTAWHGQYQFNSAQSIGELITVAFDDKGKLFGWGKKFNDTGELIYIKRYDQ